MAALLLLAAAVTPAIAQETCGTYPATSPNNSANYILGTAGGEAAAMKWSTGLVWKRCAEDQSWDGSTCTGSATVTAKSWNDRMVDYMPKPFADLHQWWTDVIGYHPPTMPTSSPNRLLTGVWRMPYKNALRGLTSGCQNGPAINRNVFPNTPPSGFWSGSPYAGYSDDAWDVSFYDGSAYNYSRNGTLPVRLVRGGQPFGTLASPPSQSALANTTIAFSAITLQASHSASGNTAWGGARIQGQGNPEFEVNASGQWVTEAIVKSGDAIQVHLTSGAVGSSRTATLILHSGDTEGTADDASNVGDETTTLQETTADFTVEALPSYTLTYAAGPGGTLSGDSSQTVMQGQDGTTVTAMPNVHYHFISWDDGVLTAARTDTNVTTNIDVTAQFAIDSYTITASAPGGQGSITPATQTVNHGATAAFTVTPDTGYHVASVTGDTCTVSGSGTSYSAANITADCAVTASFAIDSYTATASVSGGHGNITPASQAVNHGGTATFSLQPDSGWRVDSVSGCGGSLSGQTYTTGPVTSNCQITVVFEAIPVSVPVPALDWRGLLALLAGMVLICGFGVRRKRTG